MWRHITRNLFMIAGLLAGQLSVPVAAREVSVAIGTSLAPYVIEETDSGMELDVVRESLALRGHTMTGRYPSLRQVPVLFEKSVVDAAMTVNEHLGLQGCLSDVVISYQNVAITLARNELEIDSVADLAGKTVVAFQSATTYLGKAYASAVANAEQYSEVDNQLFQVNRLYAGREQVVVSDKNIFIYYRNKAAYIDTAQALRFHMIFPPSPYRVAFHDQQLCEDFNAGLRDLRESGRYDEIIAKYVDMLK